MKRAPLFALALCAAAQAEPVNYLLDPTHTFVTFEVRHQGLASVRGRFDRKEGTARLDRAAKTGRVEVSFETASVNTGVAALDRALQGAEGFDSATHPKATFVAERMVFANGQPAEVPGQLTLKGRTQPLVLKAVRFNCYLNPIFKREVCGGDFEAVVRRGDWGVGLGLPALAPDEVRLLVQVEGVPQ